MRSLSRFTITFSPAAVSRPDLHDDDARQSAHAMMQSGSTSPRLRSDRRLRLRRRRTDHPARVRARAALRGPRSTSPTPPICPMATNPWSSCAVAPSPITEFLVGPGRQGDRGRLQYGNRCRHRLAARALSPFLSLASNRRSNRRRPPPAAASSACWRRPPRSTSARYRAAGGTLRARHPRSGAALRRAGRAHRARRSRRRGNRGTGARLRRAAACSGRRYVIVLGCTHYPLVAHIVGGSPDRRSPSSKTARPWRGNSPRQLAVRGNRRSQGIGAADILVQRNGSAEIEQVFARLWPGARAVHAAA